MKNVWYFPKENPAPLGPRPLGQEKAPEKIFLAKIFSGFLDEKVSVSETDFFEMSPHFSAGWGRANLRENFFKKTERFYFNEL